MEALIRVENIMKKYRSGDTEIYALRNVTLTLQPRTLNILRGRSGSGKTTLMNMIGALERPDGGSIYIGGRDICHATDRQRDALRRNEVGYVFQSVALMPSMSAYENIDFALRVSGTKSVGRHERTVECLTLVGLHGRMGHRPHELSGGEQQRVAIARAIAHKPGIILADEPTAELDTHLGLQVVRILKDLVESEGITVLMSTHDPEMAEIADKVFEIEDGEIFNA